MDTVNQRTLQKLSQQQAWPSISLFMPAYRAMPDTKQNPVRFKNLVSQTEEQLKKRGLNIREIRRSLLEPADELLHDVLFWKQPSDGLAVFITGNVVQRFWLPIPLEEKVHIDDRPHLAPIVPAVQLEDEFIVLAVSQNRARLMEVDRLEARPMTIPGMPQNLAALNYDTQETILNAQSIAPRNRKKQGMVFHGVGGAAASDLAKDELRAFLRAIDRAVTAALNKDERPLMVVSVGSEFAMYQEENTYPHLLPVHVEANADYWTDHELRTRAWEKWTDYQQQERARRKDRLQDLIGKKLASSDLEEILQAAQEGRVHELHVTPRVRLNGDFDPNTRKVELLDGAPDAADLVELAIRMTLEQGGLVKCVESPHELPEGGPLTAVFRYRLTDRFATEASLAYLAETQTGR